jgi:hypothetical protein
MRLGQSPFTPSRASAVLAFVTATLVLPAIAGNLQAQGDTLETIAFTNDTGVPVDGLRIRFTQALAPDQPTLIPGGATTIPPFPVPPTYLAPDEVEFTGATVLPGARVPSLPGSFMRFEGTSSDKGLDILQVYWLSNGVITHTMSRLEFKNFTGEDANRLDFQVIGESGAPLMVSSVSVPADYRPIGCPPTVSGVPGTMPMVDLPCCVSGFGGLVGPIQITILGEEPIAHLVYELSFSGAKKGSAVSFLFQNREGLDGGPLQAAYGFSLCTNLPVTEIFPRRPEPLDSVVGLRTRDLYFCGGRVPAEGTLLEGTVVLTSNDTGPTNIALEDTRWFRVDALEGSVPELLYYPFDEAGGSTTENLADPGVGLDPAPVNGHLLGVATGQFGGALQGVGGSSNTNFVDTGWTPGLGDSDFTLGFWIDANGVSMTQLFGICGEPTSLFVTSIGPFLKLHLVHLGLPAALAIHAMPGGIPAGPASFAWVRDGGAGVVRMYVDGVLVGTDPTPTVTLNGLSPFKVGGVTPLRALPLGVSLDEFRLYARALSSSEIADTFGSPLPLVPPGPDQWQVNTVDASMDVDGQAGDDECPAVIHRCLGENATINLTSANSQMPWDLAASANGQAIQPFAFTGTAFGGQPVNLDPYGPGVGFVNGLQFLLGFSNTSVPITSPIPVDVHAQFVIAAPSRVGGAALSAPISLVFTDRGTRTAIVGPLGDDATLEIQPGMAPLCGPTSIPFAGSSWTSLFVNSNGSVSFGSGDLDASPTAGEFSMGPPRLAGLWSDLTPGPGGEISTEVIGGAVVVSFRSVPTAGGAGTASFDLTFALNGSASIFGFEAPAGFTGDSLVGFSPGSGAPDPGGISFASFIGQGLQTGPANRMVYELHSGGAPQPFYSVVFPLADGSQFVVN